ncbi:MAG TPA: lanthionine synthetase LanC family protein [Thermoanaerobaculia bacterium]|nr:lanthionine synthetase LanC family protein [Thermoanaerobaculia bacterium]
MTAQPIEIPVAAPRERFLDVAWSIGARLCRDAIWDDDRCNWLGDSMEAHGGEWKVAHRSYGPELYSGTSGIALFLTRLNRIRPDPVLAATARGAIRQALSRVHESVPEIRHALYSGWTGIALALLDSGDLLDKGSLKKEALRLLDGIRGKELDPMSLDVVSGAAGAILGLCAIDRRLGGDRFLDEARRLGEHLLTHAHRNDDGWSWTTMPPMGPGEQKDLTGYSHGAAGIALALLELHARTNDARFLEAAQQGFAYERKHFSAEQQNWPDFRSFASPNPQQPGYSLAWCHGAPGIGLSRLRAFALTKDETWKREAESAIAGTYRPLTMPSPAENFSLCHGTGGNAELFIHAAEVLGDERYRSVAEAVGDRGIQTVQAMRNPWPCGVVSGGESPNLMLGTAGIGYFYLRLYDSATVPSMLQVTG